MHVTDVFPVPGGGFDRDRGGAVRARPESLAYLEREASRAEANAGITRPREYNHLLQIPRTSAYTKNPS